MEEYHVPVLLEEAVDGLNIHSDGCYLDLTFGGGGHSRVILRRLGKKGRLMAFDRDEDVFPHIPKDERLIFVNHNFRYIRNFVRYYNLKVNGIIADLGVSSHDFDDAGRGFSFRFDFPLDMRMSRKSESTAADILNNYSLEALIRIFREYGEVDNARSLAAFIVKGREERKIVTSGEFCRLIERFIPKNKEKKYLAKVYQALRIEVNGELSALEKMLHDVEYVLEPGGRLAVITYHSLEDRLVKNFIKFGNTEGVSRKDPVYGYESLPFKAVNRKVILPSEEEIAANPRARSAKLRIAEKL